MCHGYLLTNNIVTGEELNKLSLSFYLNILVKHFYLNILVKHFVYFEQVCQFFK